MTFKLRVCKKKMILTYRVVSSMGKITMRSRKGSISTITMTIIININNHKLIITLKNIIDKTSGGNEFIQ